MIDVSDEDPVDAVIELPHCGAGQVVARAALPDRVPATVKEADLLHNGANESGETGWMAHRNPSVEVHTSDCCGPRPDEPYPMATRRRPSLASVVNAPPGANEAWVAAIRHERPSGDTHAAGRFPRLPTATRPDPSGATAVIEESEAASAKGLPDTCCHAARGSAPGPGPVPTGSTRGLAAGAAATPLRTRLPVYTVTPTSSLTRATRVEAPSPATTTLRSSMNTGPWISYHARPSADTQPLPP